MDELLEGWVGECVGQGVGGLAHLTQVTPSRLSLFFVCKVSR